MKKINLALSILGLTIAGAAQADYTYNLLISNKTNVPITITDRDATVATLGINLAPLLLAITDDGMSVDIRYNNNSLCKTNLKNYLDFTTPLQWNKKGFSVNLIGYVNQHSQLINCNITY